MKFSKCRKEVIRRTVLGSRVIRADLVLASIASQMLGFNDRFFPATGKRI